MQPEHRITFEAVESDIKQPFTNSYVYSAPLPNWTQQEVEEFQDTSYRPTPKNYQSVLLIELQK